MAINLWYRTPEENQEIQAEIDQLKAHRQTATGRAFHCVERFFIRSLRIGGGACLGLAAYLADTRHSGLGDTPFASLTLNIVIRGVGLIVLTLSLAFCAFALAFGAGPTDADLERKAEQNWQVTRDARLDRERVEASIAQRYSRSRIWGLLTDPELGLKGRPRLQALLIVGLIVGAYALIFLSGKMFGSELSTIATRTNVEQS